MGVLAALLALALIFALGINTGFARPKLALVLGGGSSRGLSHIGLLKAFEEEGIPVDYIVGTSMGSVVAGLYAAGFSADNLEHMVRHIALGDLFVPTLPPRGGLIDSRRFEIFLDELTEEMHFADAPIPFYTVVMDLNTGQEVTLSQGRLSQGILASMSVPGVFPPVVIDGRYFVDGGLRNLTPVSVARGVGADVVVAVDVRRTIDDIDHDALSSNLQLTLMLLLAQETDGELVLADIVIAPEVDSASYMDYERLGHFIEQGYRAAKAKAPELQGALRALDPTMTFEPQATGWSGADFSRHLDSAVASYERQGGGATWSFRWKGAWSGPGLAATEGRLIAPLGGQQRRVPLFGSFGWQAGSGRNLPRLGVGVGRCNYRCVGLLLRREDTLDRWEAGIGVEGRLNRVGYEAALFPGSPTTGHLRIAFPAPFGSNEGGEWRFSVEQNDRVGPGLHRNGPETELLHRHRIPIGHGDVLEAMRISTALYVGGGIRGILPDGATLWHPVAELGLAFESRLFGLYPVHARIGMTYRGGDESPWSIGFSLGEP